jgi:hypothetical protein
MNRRRLSEGDYHGEIHLETFALEQFDRDKVSINFWSYCRIPTTESRGEPASVESQPSGRAAGGRIARATFLLGLNARITAGRFQGVE